MVRLVLWFSENDGVVGHQLLVCREPSFVDGRSLGGYADPGSEREQSSHRGGAGRGQELEGQGLDGRPGTDLFGRAPFGNREGFIAFGWLAPLVVGAGDVDPVPGLPLG